jgi:hypothetical protein
VMRKLARRSPAPQPSPRRRRRGDTRRSFQASAKKITRIVDAVLTPLAYAAFLPDWDITKWLQQWAECDQACAEDYAQSSERPEDFGHGGAALSPEP